MEVIENISNSLLWMTTSFCVVFHKTIKLTHKKTRKTRKRRNK